MSYFIDPARLQKLPEDQVKIIDVRGKEAYDEGHLVGAFCFDMKSDFTGHQTFFPRVDTLAQKLGESGINEKDTIVIYDSGINRNAAKAWVVLHYIGHEDVRILQGGFAAWQGAKGEVIGDKPKVATTTYRPNVRVDVAVELEEMQEKLQDNQSVLIDSRAKERYTGEKEPTYAQAGHIPGAVHYASKDVFTDDGLWQDRQALKKHFHDVSEKSEVVVSCGSGTSACMNFVALKEAGIKDVKLYPGGVKEWIDTGHDVVTGH